MRGRILLTAALAALLFGAATTEARAQSQTGGYQSGFGFLPSQSRFYSFYSYGPTTSYGGFSFTPNLQIAPAWVQTNPDVWTYAPVYRAVIAEPVYTPRHVVVQPTPPVVTSPSNVYAPGTPGASPVQGPAAPLSPPTGGLGMPRTAGSALR